jgi:endonuclease-3 related protein
MVVTDVFERLMRHYGPQGWGPGSGGFETVAGAILTQHATWRNAERALENLRAANALTTRAVAGLDPARLVHLIRPAGCFEAKARTLKAFCEMIESRFGGSLDACFASPAEQLRMTLLNTRGIGPETADAILLYAAGRPTFVVDAFARRIFSRLGWVPAGNSYEDWRRYFMSRFPARADLCGEYHALLVRHAHECCLPAPRCDGCVLRGRCAFSRNARPVSSSSGGVT